MSLLLGAVGYWIGVDMINGRHCIRLYVATGIAVAVVGADIAGITSIDGIGIGIGIGISIIVSTNVRGGGNGGGGRIF